jgi:hypothetical protein
MPKSSAFVRPLVSAQFPSAGSDSPASGSLRLGGVGLGRGARARGVLHSANWLLAGVLMSGIVACGGSTSDEGRGNMNTPPTRIDEDAGAQPPSENDQDGGTSPSPSSEDPDEPAPGGSEEPGTSPTTPGATPPVMTTTPGKPTEPSTPVGTGRPPVVFPPPVGTTSPIEEVVNCQPPTVRESTDYCEATQQCDNDSIYSYCKSDGTGSWSCQCADNYGSRSFTVPGGDPSVCVSSLALCTPGEQPEVTGSECQDATTYLSGDYCSAQRACTSSADIAGGSASIYDYQYSNCQIGLGGAITCSCSANGYSQLYELSDTTLAAACTDSLGLCAEQQPLDFPEELTCKASYRSQSPSDCQYNEECRSEVPVQDGVVAIYSEAHNSSCYDAGTGSWQCNCYDATNSMSFEVAADQIADLDLCPTTLSLCNDFDASQLSEGECTRTSESAGDTYCNAQVSCEHTGTVSGLDITVLGYVSTDCQIAEDGSWNCNCYGGTTSASHSLMAEDAWTACELSTDVCPGLVPTTANGGNVGFPIPLAR